eukprot:7066458-Alexandrium_andersonii.AAC.1
MMLDSANVKGRKLDHPLVIGMTKVSNNSGSISIAFVDTHPLFSHDPVKLTWLASDLTTSLTQVQQRGLGGISQQPERTG